MNDVLLLVLSLSLSGSVLALLVLALGPFAQKKLSQTWRYYIWLVVILRFLLPFSPGTSLVGGIAGYVREAGNPSDTRESVTFLPFDRSETNAASFVLPVSPPVDGRTIERPVYGSDERTPPVGWSILSNHLWLVWLGIALALFARKAASYRSFTRLIRSGNEPVTDERTLALYRDVLAGAGIRRPLPIFHNSQVASPMLIGILRPALVLPELAASDGELRGILRHELTHYKRLDFLYKWLVQITVCLHWFNPLPRVIAKRINRSCELSCDEAVIRRLNEAGRVTYGDALIASLSARGGHSDFVVTMSMSESGEHVKERLDAILRFKKRTALTTVIAAGLTALLLAGFSFAGAYSPATAGNREEASEPAREPEQPHSRLYGMADAFDAAALSVLEETGVWANAELLLPFLSTRGINEAVALYNQMNPNYARNAEDYYGLPLPTAADVDHAARELMKRTGNPNALKPFLPYASPTTISLLLREYQHTAREALTSKEYYGILYENNPINRYGLIIRDEEGRNALARGERSDNDFEKYAPFGLAHGVGLSYNNEPVRLFVDYSAEKEPGMAYAFDLYYAYSDFGVCLEAVEDEDGNVVGVEPMRADVAREILSAREPLFEVTGPSYIPQ